MAYEHKDMTGSIFKNDRKEKETHPDYKGKCKINGQMLDVALWIKDGRNGKFFSASFSEPYQKEQPKDYPQKTETFDDDLPF